MSIEELDFSTSIENSLIATDRLLKQWANGADLVERGPGIHPLKKIQLMKDGAVFGGGGPIPEPKEVTICELLIRKSPQETQLFLKLWYRDTITPVGVKASRLGISRSEIYARWREQVNYIRGRLHGHGVKV
jgi:hypothetical protein